MNMRSYFVTLSLIAGCDFMVAETPLPPLPEEGMMSYAQPPTAPSVTVTSLGTEVLEDTHCAVGPPYFCESKKVVTQCSEIDGDNAVLVERWECPASCAATKPGYCKAPDPRCVVMMTCKDLEDGREWEYKYCTFPGDLIHVKATLDCAVKRNGERGELHACGTDGFFVEVPKNALISPYLGTCTLTSRALAAGWTQPSP